MKKFQEQNEAYQANRAKMAEGMALALEKKDQVIKAGLEWWSSWPIVRSLRVKQYHCGQQGAEVAVWYEKITAERQHLLPMTRVGLG